MNKISLYGKVKSNVVNQAWTSYGMLLVLCVWGQLLSAQDKDWKRTGSPSGWVTCIAQFDSKLIAGIYEKGIYESSDIGKTWVENSANVISKYPTSVSIIGGTIYVTTLDKGVLMSKNDGKSWQILDKGLEGKATLNMTLFKDELLIGTTNGMYTLQERVWEAIPLDFNSFRPQHRRVQGLVHTANHLFVGSNNRLFVYDSLEDNWEVFIVPTLLEITFLKVDAGVLSIGTSGDGVFQLDVSKRKIEPNFSAIEHNVRKTAHDMLFDQENPMVAFSSNLIKVKGVEFTEKSKNLETNILHLCKVGDLVFAGTGTQGVLVFDASDDEAMELRSEDPAAITVAKTFNLVAYPNPSSGWVSVSIENPELAELELTVYSADGKVIRHQDFSKNGEPMLESYSLTLENLNPGVFTLVLKSAGAQQLQNIIVQ